MRYIPYPYLAYPYYHPQWPFVSNHAPTNPQYAIKPEISFPPINTKRLNGSAKKVQKLIKQADLLMEKIINDSEFAHALMDAAQLSDKKKVEDLILSTGITIKVETNYNPTGLRLELNNAEENDSCCNLLMTLSW